MEQVEPNPEMEMDSTIVEKEVEKNEQQTDFTNQIHGLGATEPWIGLDLINSTHEIDTEVKEWSLIT